MKRLTILVAIGALLLTACATPTEVIEEVTEAVPTEEVDVAPDPAQNDQGRVETEEAPVVTNGGDLPDGFPVPLPDGYTVVGVMTTDGESIVQVSYALDRRDELVEHFDEWTAGHLGDWHISMMMSGDAADGTLVSIMTYDEENMQISIIVADCFAIPAMKGLVGLSEIDVPYDAMCVFVTHPQG